MLLLASQNRNSRLSLITRIVGAFLLAAIAWGSTFEFTHNHRAGSLTRSQTVPTETQINGNEQAASRQLPPLSSRTSTSECSICQLHHNLATTLISQPAGVSANASQSIAQFSLAQFELTEYRGSRHGRAPPVFSLS
jgi:hypothetical protein